jgi:hypothetical protein
MQLLYDTVDDFLKAKNDRDRRDAMKTAVLCLEHGSYGAEKRNTAILDEFERLEGAEAASFYKQHKDTILS